MDTNLLKLPVQKVPVRLRYASDEEIVGEIYLSQRSPIHLGPMTIRELLEQPAPFFAFARADRGDVLLNKELVEVVRYDRGLFADELAATDLIGRGRKVTIDLIGGLRVEGELCEDQPPERARPIDGLNQPGRFLRLRQEDQFVLVNKARVLRGYA